MFAADLARMLALQLGWLALALLSSHFPAHTPWPMLLALVWLLGALLLHTALWGRYARRAPTRKPLPRTAELAFGTSMSLSAAFVDLLEWFWEAFPERHPPAPFGSFTFATTWPEPPGYFEVLPFVALYCAITTIVACACAASALKTWGRIEHSRLGGLLQVAPSLHHVP